MPAAVALRQGEKVNLVTRERFDNFRDKVSKLEVPAPNQTFYENLEPDKQVVWTPQTCDEIREFLLDVHRTATNVLKAREVLKPEGDEYDRRNYRNQLDEIHLLQKQLLTIIKLLVVCTTQQLVFSIELVESQ